MFRFRSQSPRDKLITERGAEFSFSSRLRGWLWGLFLIIATFAAYQPAWNGKPIWDDAAHLTYPEHRSFSGLVRIWTEPGATQQYYPAVYSVFWVEHKLWGDATLGYHLVNVLLHVTAALLFLKILRTLNVPAAGLTAAIFALHPVQVESVAWISELKNTLSAVCYFGSALAYLRFDRTREKPAYAGALAFFVLGLLSKTVIATLPAALLVVFWWQRGKLSWKRDVLPLAPFFAAAITAGLFTSWMERHLVGAQGSEFNFSIIERFLIAGRAVWFYLGKLFWPADLIFSYPRWQISQTIAWQYLFPAATVLALGALWVLRRWARGPLAALLFFIGTLFPALGFVNVYPFKFSFVADHFQYIACCGPIVAASVGIHALFQRCAKAKRVWEPAFCAILLAVLGVLTWRRSRMYSDIETLWRTTIARNPGSGWPKATSALTSSNKEKLTRPSPGLRTSLQIRPDNAEAENNLGAALARKGQMDEAIRRFRAAIALRPNFAEAENNLGHSLLQKGQVEDAILEFQKAVALRPDLVQYRATLAHAHFDLGVALRQKGQKEAATLEFQEAVNIQPDFAEAQNDLGNSLLQIGRVDEAIAHLKKALEVQPAYAQAHYNLGNALLQKGQLDEAVTQFQKLLAIQPDSLEARRTLAGIAWRLATSPNPAQRNGTKAIELAEQQDRLVGGGNPMTAAILAAAYAETGRFDRAVEAARRALELADREGNKAMIAAIQVQLNTYRAGSPFRDTGSGP